MGDHEARVRKLVTTFNTLSNESKNLVLEGMETLKLAESPVSTKRDGNRPYPGFITGACFNECEKLC